MMFFYLRPSYSTVFIRDMLDLSVDNLDLAPKGLGPVYWVTKDRKDIFLEILDCPVIVSTTQGSVDVIPLEAEQSLEG